MNYNPLEWLRFTIGGFFYGLAEKIGKAQDDDEATEG